MSKDTVGKDTEKSAQKPLPKGDYTSPKAYRPIALWNTLGKVFGLIMANKITYLAEESNCYQTPRWEPGVDLLQKLH